MGDVSCANHALRPVAFLVSPQGEWINGQVIRVNGGFA
jgi:NAD(P)-dependent dehydrogenase (short-subunit alcohol dehydrogenase family)